MTPASASPIATQETDYPAIWLEPKCNGDSREWCSADMWDECEECGTSATRYVRADLHDAALSASEKRNEELVRELTEAQQIVSGALLGRDDAHEALVTSLKAEVERLRDTVKFAADRAAELNLFGTEEALRGAIELPAPAVSTTGEEDRVVTLRRAGEDLVRLIDDDLDYVPNSECLLRFVDALDAFPSTLPPVPGDPVEEGR